MKKAEAEDERNPGMFWANKMRRFDGMLDGEVHGFLDVDSGFTRADKVSPSSYYPEQ